jgi:putative DNA methylase
MTAIYPKRLIEVDLPIKRISAHSRREKSIRHGHISTLHIWWARRPLAACRAVICAALWPDPADELCPDSFRDAARKLMSEWATDHLGLLGEESSARFIEIRNNRSKLDDNIALRQALLDFIADFSNWDTSTVREYLDTSRALTQAAHEALGGAPGTRPLVVDPFAGGGSIPLEALRVGADAFASDLNPVAVLLNKVVLEYIPKYGQQLADEVRKWGEWIKCEAEKELAEFYPKDADGATPIAYLWARTIKCEGPGCGAEVPLIRSTWLAKKSSRSIALQLVPNAKAKRVDFRIIIKKRGEWVEQAEPETKIKNPKFDGTVKLGSATCQCCGFTTDVGSVRTQLKRRAGGTLDARLTCVVRVTPGQTGRSYELPTPLDELALKRAAVALERLKSSYSGELSLVPDESLDVRGIRANFCMLYGLNQWNRLFNCRQLLSLVSLSQLVEKVGRNRYSSENEELGVAVKTCLALVVDKVAQYNSSLCRWKATGENLVDTFGRQALPMVWDFAEANVIGGASGDFGALLGWICDALANNQYGDVNKGIALRSSATLSPLPTDSAAAFITDPPYYDAVPYACLSDFFYGWLRRSLRNTHADLFASPQVPKEEEIVVDRPHSLSKSEKDVSFYERELAKAFADGRRALHPGGIGVIVFASKSTVSWEAIIQAIVDAGWIITGSWPIDTEMGSRLRAMNSAALASSVHIACRPRENPDGAVRTDEIGDWRDVLQELPRRTHEWMPRLAEEGVVGADAIFACLGPALEIFSRYSRVEKASGEQVTLREHLEHVWAAVAKEALNMIFEGADATGFEEDARLTAMWLWTLNAAANGNGQAEPSDEPEGTEDADEQAAAKKKASGYALEFDAARKIAQGLGAHLEDLRSVVEVKGDKARLLSVAERSRFLFGKQEEQSPKQRKKKKPQLALFDAGKSDDEEDGGLRGDFTLKTGETVLDRVHQSLILFGAGRSEALKRFLVEDGAGRDQRFWRLAQALAALYPPGTDERRWVEGLLARKKGLGF